MKRRKLTRWEWALFATPFLSLMSLLRLSVGESTPLTWRFLSLSPREQTRKASCQNNFKQLAVAFLQYSQDYNGTFPPAAIGGVRPALVASSWTLNPPVGWVDALYSYTKSSTVNVCPSSTVPAWNGPNSPRATHMWFNGKLSSYRKANLSRPAATILIGEGSDGYEVADGTYNKTALPAHWIGDYSMPCYRHFGGANYSFADGHTKWLPPSQISTIDGAAYTFSTR